MADTIKQNAPGSGEGSFSLGVEMLSRALKAFFIILAAFIIIAIAWFFVCGGSFIVDTTTESVVVLKFGKFYKQYDEGWHWFLPYPINKIVRIPIIKQEVRTKAFVPSDPDLLYNPGKEINPERPPSDTLLPGKDGYVLLGDNSIMHSEWVMTYKVADPTRYFLNFMSRETASEDSVSGPDDERVTLAAASAILKNLLDDAVVCASARLDIQKTYYEKAYYEQTVKQQLIQNLNKMDIGIALESLTLRLVAPPIKTLGAFQQLLLSETLAGRVVEEARTYSVEQLNKAKTDASKVIADAEAYRTRVVSEVVADSGYFRQILKEYNKNPQATLVSLFSVTLAESMAPVKDKFVVGIDGKASQNLWLKLNQEPTVKKTEKQKKTGE